MKRILACLLVVVAAVPVSAGTAGSRADDCRDVAAYFAHVDEVIAAGITSLIEQPGFQATFEEASTKTEETDTGFLALSSDERAAIIEYLRVPGDALAPIDAEEVPDAVRPLHDSALRYWVGLADMMQAISEDSPSAAIPFLDDLDTAAIDNDTAQQALIAACPDEVAAWADAFDHLAASDAVSGYELFTALADADLEDMEGIGYTFLFFAIEEDASDQ